MISELVLRMNTLVGRMEALLPELSKLTGVIESPSVDLMHWHHFEWWLVEWQTGGMKRHMTYPFANKPTVHSSGDDCFVFPHDIWALKAAGYIHSATHEDCSAYGYRRNGEPHPEGPCLELREIERKVPGQWADVPIA